MNRLTRSIAMAGARHPWRTVTGWLLSIGGAFDVLVFVFQWGHGARLLGLDGPTPITSIIVVIMFPILFGLSMDYEVFLLSRIREEFVRTGDNAESVARGLAVAITIDATVVRMMLVPATMTLLGRTNWWLPAWLDRVPPVVTLDEPAVTPYAAEPTAPAGAELVRR